MINETARHMGILMSRGDFMAGCDGYYVWWPTDQGKHGAFSAHHLREIADFLDGANEAWDRQVQSDPRIAG